jgi:hypothetical protein
VPITDLEATGMFDVYVRGKSQLLVIRRGAPLPAGLVGGWRKKRATRTVSDEISGAVVREGFYTRSQMPLIDTPVDVRAS